PTNAGRRSRGLAAARRRCRPVAAELVGRDVAAQAHPAVAAIERLAARAAAPAGRVRRHPHRIARLRAVTGDAVLLAVTRRAARDVALGLARVTLVPALRVERIVGRVEAALAAR